MQATSDYLKRNNQHRKQVQAITSNANTNQQSTRHANVLIISHVQIRRNPLAQPYHQLDPYLSESLPWVLQD
jgi:hypothetical protein